MDAISAAKSGVVTAIARFDGASSDLANAFTRRGGADAARAAVNLVYTRNGVLVTAAVLKTATKMRKALLDIKV